MSRHPLVWTAWLCLAFSGVSHSQEVRAGISGVISDPSRAPVPDARITVTNVAKNTSVVTDSNESGSYLTPFLEPGTYTLTVEKSGFKRFQQQNIELQTLDRARVDIRLEI